MPVAEAEAYRYDVFDITKVWPHADYPPMTIGRMVLDSNPENYFAEVEQAAFSPGNFVPGIGPSPTTRCCRPGCSATTTRTSTGWARTTTCCR